MSFVSQLTAIAVSLQSTSKVTRACMGLTQSRYWGVPIPHPFYPAAAPFHLCFPIAPFFEALVQNSPKFIRRILFLDPDSFPFPPADVNFPSISIFSCRVPRNDPSFHPFRVFLVEPVIFHLLLVLVFPATLSFHPCGAIPRNSSEFGERFFAFCGPEPNLA